MDPEQQTTPPEKPSRRDYDKDRQASRLRGNRRALLTRYGLRHLPPIEEDEP